MFKYLVLGAAIFLVYRFVASPALKKPDDKEIETPSEFTDYEELE